MKHLGKHLLSLVLMFSLIFSMTTAAFAGTNENVDVSLQTALSDDEAIEPQSAGLAWGPVTVGNIKLSITNPHTGYVPGLGNAEHINFHADNVKTKKPILNYHIVKYTSGTSTCLYVYDSVSKKVVFNNCFKSWTDAVGAVVESVKSAVSAVLSEADWLATIAIWGVVIVVLVDLIIPMDPIPILPFSAELPISEYYINEELEFCNI